MALIKNGSAKQEKGAPDDPLGQYTAHLISDTGGLTQFGAFIEELAPGAASSLDHWHANEDEMVYILAGSPTLREDGVEVDMAPGDAACWKAGETVAHCLINRSGAPVRYLVIGTRASHDQVTYPHHDRVLLFNRTLDERTYTTLNGYPADKPIAG